MRLFRWLRDLWWAQQRRTDMQILWPVCKETTPTLDHAKAAFALHAYNDPAWVKHYGEDGLYNVIDALQ